MICCPSIDTAALTDDAWVIRRLRDYELILLKKWAKVLAHVVAPVVLLHPKTKTLGYIWKLVVQWSMNIDAVC